MRKAFTIVEVLIAVFIFTVVIGSLVSAFDSSHRMGEFIITKNEASSITQRVVFDSCYELMKDKIVSISKDMKTVTYLPITSINPLVYGEEKTMSFDSIRATYKDIDDTFKTKPVLPNCTAPVFPGVFFYRDGNVLYVGCSVSTSSRGNPITITNVKSVDLISDINPLPPAESEDKPTEP